MKKILAIILAMAMLLCLGAIFIRSALEYFFGFILFGYENLVPFFYTRLGPQVVLTSLFSFPFCLLFRWLHGKFEPETTKV
jgi:hypothetical protein